ncbi:hypothetical protein LCGC14_0693870 [marine sediment metagenome]|uniref:Uncharacterized protein n=1 Tax=marine sediment metagenome TaxID=412755 RepID=A0A0F9T623_9ZZZZ
MVKAKKDEVVEPSFEGMIEQDETKAVDEVVGDGVENAGTILANYSETPDFDQDDVVIPRLRLAQGLTTEVQDGLARPGQWILIGYEPEDELIVVPVAFTKRREMRDDDTREVLCFSKDSKVGVGDPGGDCASCLMSQWVEGDKGKNTPPLCNFQYSYLMYVVDFEALAAMTFTKSALRTGKLLNTIVAQRGMMKCAVKLSNSQRKGPNGNYYVPVVNPTNVDDEVLAAARAKVSGDVVV